MPNTVIMVWMQHPSAGLGDLLRGTTYLCGLSEQLNFRLIVDTQLHPVSHFLIPNAHEYSDYVIQNKHRVLNLVNVASLNTVKECVLAKTNDPILLIANSQHDRPSARSIALIRTIMTPTPEFKTHFDAMCAKFNITFPYIIVHLRLGDDDLVQKNTNHRQYHALLSMIDEHVQPRANALIISDSAAFKHYLGKVRPHLANRIVPTMPVHLSHATDNDMRMINDTMFDLLLIMNARAIKTYTNYCWVSGFVRWISTAFNVPLYTIPVNKIHRL
jgi:hypothetical protein